MLSYAGTVHPGKMVTIPHRLDFELYGYDPDKALNRFFWCFFVVYCTTIIEIIEFRVALVMIYAVLSNFDFVAKFTVKNLNNSEFCVFPLINYGCVCNL